MKPWPVIDPSDPRWQPGYYDDQQPPTARKRTPSHQRKRQREQEVASGIQQRLDEEMDEAMGRDA